MKPSDWISFEDRKPQEGWALLLRAPIWMDIGYVFLSPDGPPFLWVKTTNREYPLDNHPYTHWMVIYPPGYDESTCCGDGETCVCCSTHGERI